MNQNIYRIRLLQKLNLMYSEMQISCKGVECIFTKHTVPNYENIHIRKSIQNTNVKECNSRHLRKKEFVKQQVGAIVCLFYMYALICFHLYQI